MKKKVLKKKSEYVTTAIFEKGMDFMAKSFSKVFEKLERHDKAFESMFKEMQNYGKEAREHRMTMSGLNISDITQEREIEGLKVRVEKLEQKLK